MKPEIAKHQNQPQLSPILLDELGKEPVFISCNLTTLLLFKRYLEAIEAIGEQEHSGDWDLYLSINLIDGTEFSTVSGYPNIVLKDLSGKILDDDESNSTLDELGIFSGIVRNNLMKEIGFYPELDYPDGSNNDENPEVVFFKLEDIVSIQIFR